MTHGSNPTHETPASPPPAASTCCRGTKCAACATPLRRHAQLLRRCALAVLTSGSASDDPRAARELYPGLRHPGAAAGPRHHASTWSTRRRWPSSTARSSAASPNCCSRSCATSPTSRSRSARQRLRPRRRRDGITDAVFEILRNARILRPHRSEPGGVLGRPFDRPRRVRLHQAGRLRAGPARPRHLHRLRPGRDEGPDEGRDHRPRQAAPARATATSASPSPASSPPSRRTRSSTTW